MATLDIRAALHAEIHAALSRLAAKRGLDDESIHAIRQGLKRARAALRLLRDAVPKRTYAAENACLRDAARPLAPVRDAAVMLGELEEMIADRKFRGYRPLLVGLRAELRKSHARHLANARANGTLRTMRRLLKQSLQRTAQWRTPRDAVYARGIARVYRKGRKALQTAEAEGSVGALHEWRKQVKYLAAGMALIDPGKSGFAKAARIADLGGQLGEDHDLAQLAAALRRAGAEPTLLAGIERRRRNLQKQAFKSGRRLYRRAPHRLASPN